MKELNTRQYEGRDFWWLKEDNGAWNGPHKEFKGLHNLCLKYCKSKKIVVTAGGCLGLYPVLWADTFERVITFEPCPHNFDVLDKNCEKFHPRIERYHAALGDSNQDTLLYWHSTANVGTHSTVRNSGSSTKVRQMMVDDIDLPGLDLLSLDIEGAETYAIRGALKTIDKFLPVISIETMDQTIKQILDDRKYQQVGKNVSDSVFAVL